MVSCPVCGEEFGPHNFDSLAIHFVDLSKVSDTVHITWLNRNISKNKTDSVELSSLLSNYFSLGGKGISNWIIRNFVNSFRGDNPHPFIVAMQDYNEDVLRGYVLEHHHFLKQWIKSCAYVIAKSDIEAIQDYELENIMTELHGFGAELPSHHELLIRMGESLGLTRNEILNSIPLPATANAVKVWNNIASNKTWIEAMTAMHSLELIANRDLGKYGAKYAYFNPDILKSDLVKREVKDFLREGYEADVSHSYVALSLVEKHCTKENVEEIQSSFLRSSMVFSSYLDARLQRGEMIENK
jgi:pyrroloquinoline-quinone synthase